MCRVCLTSWLILEAFWLLHTILLVSEENIDSFLSHQRDPLLSYRDVSRSQSVRRMVIPSEDVTFPASFYHCTITCFKSESADKDDDVNISAFFIILQRFVRAEGRANEAFWISACKLLPPKLWHTALGVRHCT